MRHLVFIVAAVLATALPAAAEKRAATAGLRHPDVIAVRGIYREVEDRIADGQLKKEERHAAGCSPWSDDRTIYANTKGAIRKYVWEYGGDDSAFTVRHYYDRAGRLRFVFVTAGAVNGTVMEQRIYFNERGARIRETRVLVAGAGYTFPQFSEEEGLLQHDPRRAYEKVCP